MIVSLSMLITISGASASAVSAATGISVPVVGTVPGGGTLNAVFTLTRFAVQNQQIVAVGTLSGTLTDATGLVRSFVQNVVLAVTAQATCQILHLELGPLDLDILGLMVHLDKVVLDITAQSGPGNLLGNLLCAVANLLNSGGALTQLVNLLNQILGSL
jgi:hypothetical protein